MDPPYSLDYDYYFDEGNAVGSYDEYYNEMYDTHYDNLDKSRKVKSNEIDNEEKQNIDYEDARKDNYEEEKIHVLKSVKDSFRPSINLNSILPSSNAFIPSRGNGKIFREFVRTHNNRDGGFLKESIEESDNIRSLAGSNIKSNVDGDHRITSFTSFPLRTNAKTLQQLFSQGQQSLKLVRHKDSHNSRSDGITTDSEFRADTFPKGIHNTKENLSIEQSSFTGISNNKPSHQPELNKLRSTNNWSNKRVSRIDPDKLMIYYPLSGKPFLSFPPSKSFSTIAKRQIL